MGDAQQPRLSAFFKKATVLPTAAPADPVAALVAQDDARKRKADDKADEERRVRSIVEATETQPAPANAASAFVALGRGRRGQQSQREPRLRGRPVGSTTRPDDKRQAEEEGKERRKAQREAEKNAILEGFDAQQERQASLHKVLFYVRDRYKQLFRCVF